MTRFTSSYDMGFMPDGSTFNGTRNILPENYYQSLKVGDKLNNNDINPLIYLRD